MYTKMQFSGSTVILRYSNIRVRSALLTSDYTETIKALAKTDNNLTTTLTELLTMTTL